MSFTGIVERRISGLGGDGVAVQESFTSDAVDSRDISISAVAADDFLVNIAIDVDQVKAFLLYSPSSALTIETNDGAAPSNTINLVAGKPYLWCSGDYSAFLLTVDVTKIYVTNTGDVATTLYIRVLQDATP